MSLIGTLLLISESKGIGGERSRPILPEPRQITHICQVAVLSLKMEAAIRLKRGSGRSVSACSFPGAKGQTLHRLGSGQWHQEEMLLGPCVELCTQHLVSPRCATPLSLGLLELEVEKRC